MDGKKGRKTKAGVDRGRSPVEEVELEEADKEKEAAAVIVEKAKVWVSLGTVDNVAKAAESGDVEALRALSWMEGASANNGQLGKRWRRGGQGTSSRGGRKQGKIIPSNGIDAGRVASGMSYLFSSRNSSAGGGPGLWRKRLR